MSDDPYGDCLNAMMVAVRTLTDLFPKANRVSLDHGAVEIGGDYWFICTPSAFPSRRLDGREKIVQWQTECDLYVRYKTEKDSVPKLLIARAKVKALLEKPRVLKNLNVNSVTVSGNRLVQDVAGENFNFLIQPLIVTIEQIVAS